MIYINPDQMHFSMTMLASFGSTHIDNLKLTITMVGEGVSHPAGTSFNENISVLTKRRALHRETITSVSQPFTKILAGNKLFALKLNQDSEYHFTSKMHPQRQRKSHARALRRLP